MQLRKRDWSEGWLGGLALVVLCLLAYLPGLPNMPPMDRDEARYAHAARHMVEADTWEDWLVPRIQDTPRLNKPPLTYWLQALSGKLLGAERRPATAALDPQLSGTGSPRDVVALPTGGIWVYRVPSVVATLIAVLITWRLGIAMYAPGVGWLAAAILGLAWLNVLDARLARTDQLLMCFTAGAMWALWHLWHDARGPRWPWVLTLWLMTAAGTMTKGPVTPAIVVFAMIVLSAVTREWRWLNRTGWPIGILFNVAVLAGWLWATAAIVGWDDFRAALDESIVARTLSPMEGHSGPPGYYAVLISGLLWPGGLLAVPALARAFQTAFRIRTQTQPAEGLRATKRRRTLLAGRSAELFCLAWMLPAWIIFEVMETKLPTYILPLCPPVALLCARAAYAGVNGRLPLVGTPSALLGDMVWLIVGLGLLLVLPLYFAKVGDVRLDGKLLSGILAATVLIPTFAVLAFQRIRKAQFVTGILLSFVVSVVGARLMFQSVLPNIDTPWLSACLVRELERIDPNAARPLASVNFNQDSFTYLTHGRVERLAPAEVSPWLAAHPNGLLVAPAEYPGTDALDPLAAVDGFSYPDGRSMNLRIFDAGSGQRS